VLREERKAEGARTPSYNDYVVRACALALRQVPKLNASFSPDAIVYHDQVNVGVAVASDEALVVPTIFDADTKSAEEISLEIGELVAKVRASSIRIDELSGGTFTVSNLGMHGVSRFEAIISPPQVGILAVGAIREVLARGPAGVASSSRMAIVLSSDHRVVYGADAAQFLAAVRDALEQPAALDRESGEGEKP
jgi:pyruvate dehydrogenase E2 component (dihydrolipoamide acetyltransferase)